MTNESDIDPRWTGVSFDASSWHFHRQLLKRYGFVLAYGEYSWIKKAIQSGRALLVEKKSKTQAIYSVRIRGERIYVLATASGHIITAWPPEKRLNNKRRILAGKTI